MGFKDLFIVSDDKKEEIKETPKEGLKFPESVKAIQVGNVGFGTSQAVFPTTQNNQYTEKFKNTYEAIFDGLNQQGFDFYEFYKTVLSSDQLTNPTTYKMGFSMGLVMDKTLTKDKLLTQADYYVSEIQKVYQQNTLDGDNKKQSLLEDKQNEAQSLTTELASLNLQLQTLQAQIQDKSNQLTSIDNKYTPMLTELTSKLQANTQAKDNLINQITTIKNGIQQNIN